MTPLRETALMMYGRACRCPNGCSEQRLSALQFDHVQDGQGNAHRRRIYPKPLEQVLAEADYPEVLVEVLPNGQIIHHSIRLLCQRCHRSKSKHGACRIDHIEDVMDEEQYLEQDDSDLPARKIPTKLIASQKRVQAKALVQLSTRVEPHIKVWLDELSENQGISMGAVLGQIKTKVELGDVARHGELVSLLKSIDHRQHELLSMLSDLLLKQVVEPDPPEEQYPHLHPELRVLPEPQPTIPVQPTKRRHWYCLWIA
jgi:hypothetical protein